MAERAFRICEAEARAVLETVRAGADVDLAACGRTLGGVAARQASAMFADDPATRPYWIDDLMFDRVRVEGEGCLVLSGVAWCGERTSTDQWQVPAELALPVIGEAPAPWRLERMVIRLGDAGAGTLSARYRAGEAPPDAWLHSLEIDPP